MATKKNGQAAAIAPDIEVTAEIKTFAPRPAKFNGDGDEIEPPKLAITFLVPMDAIGPSITRIAWMFRHGVQPELRIRGLEQTRLADVVDKVVDRVNAGELDGDGIRATASAVT